MHSILHLRTVAPAALAIGAVLAFAPAPVLAQAIDMKVGMATMNEPQHEMGKKFAEEVGKRSNGRITGRLFPAAQLGGIPRQIEGVQLGTQEVMNVPPGFMFGINAAFSAPDAPGLFDNPMHAARAFSHPEFRDKYVALAEPKGIVIAALWVYDTTWIASTAPIRKLDDIKGKKFRVLATKVESEYMRVLGGTGVPMDYAEVAAALQSRVVDGVRTSIVVLNGSKMYTVAKSITYDGTGIIPSVVIVSKAWLDKLPADLQKVVMDAGRALEPWANQMALDFAKSAEKVWTDNGGEVIRLPEAEHKALVERVAPLGDQNLATDDRIKDMYNLLKGVVAKTRQAS